MFKQVILWRSYLDHTGHPGVLGNTPDFDFITWALDCEHLMIRPSTKTGRFERHANLGKKGHEAP